MTVEAQSYGPGSLIGIKVVEQVPAGVVQQQIQGSPAQGQAARAPTPQRQATPQRHTPGGATPQRPGGATPQRIVVTPQQPQRIAISTPQQIQPRK